MGEEKDSIMKSDAGKEYQCKGCGNILNRPFKHQIYTGKNIIDCPENENLPEVEGFAALFDSSRKSSQNISMDKFEKSVNDVTYCSSGRILESEG